MNISSLLLSNVVPALNATAFAGLIHWTETDLTGSVWAAVNRLARRRCVLTLASDTLLPATASVALPASCVAVLAVFCEEVALDPANRAELDALSEHWENDTDAIPRRFAVPADDTLILHPKIDAGLTGRTVEWYQFSRPARASTLDAPEPVGDYLALRTILDARSAEGDGRMPEAATALQPVVGLLEESLISLYGGTQ